MGNESGNFRASAGGSGRCKSAPASREPPPANLRRLAERPRACGHKVSGSFMKWHCISLCSI
ncbi:hypothetical protein DFS30_04980 [Akkermansia muciniphila]|nr:hypothetical protein CXT98_00440 [Akkermansia muciniphila]QAA61891.1 hypothetical protein C1O59_05075 [Akkermansia muciniphila]QAA64145.1 hypothetical protein C1O60_05125 [Akkermansia muciniphila]QAA66407.1 hypothetical protein C1O61_05215 [Akkermansia muciniphila]QAA68659.1 hypothetical protein C1O62_05140 [Akkermansia muciniphila]